MAQTNQRECGRCTACCFTHSVAEKGVEVTKMYDWCAHCKQGVGCAIYTERPESCAIYRCMWRSGYFGDDSKRPDRWGIILDTWALEEERETLINVWECTPGRYRSPEIQAILEALIATGTCVIVGRPLSREQDLRFPVHMDESDQHRYVRAAVNAMHAAQE